jgi:hypothetical protein
MQSPRVGLTDTWADPGGAPPPTPVPAESALFVEEYDFQCLSPVARNT